MRARFIYQFAIAILISLFSAFALEPGYCVTAEISKINPVSIGLGDEFTIGIQIENCGQMSPDRVEFSIISLPNDIIVKEPLVKIIPKLYYANSERFITYNMKLDKNGNPGKHVIKTRLSYSGSGVTYTKEYEIEFQVVAEEAKISIASVKTKPILPVEKSEVELTLRIENFGEGNANSVRVKANHPFRGLKDSFIGTLEAGEDGPAIFTFIVEEEGEYDIPITIYYKDDFGEHTISDRVTLVVLSKNTNWKVFAVIAIIIAIFLIIIIYLYATRKKKERIIHQLLHNGASLNHSEKRAKR